MRFELAGSLIHPDPLVLNLPDNAMFTPEDYILLGYTNFDVICIGGGGGSGGGINTDNTGTYVRATGGAGGGGGLHRVQGLLSALPDICLVTVGSAGILGIEHVNDPAQTTDGGDGGYSSFNDTACQASGGKGGKRVQSNSLTIPTNANGGDGGIGGSKVVGGGATGGYAGTPSATGPGVSGTPGNDGEWDGSIGEGGGGGAGGVGKYGSPPTTCNAATAGGNGSYNLGDMSVYGPGKPPSRDPASGAAIVAPGDGGGAKASPLNGLPYAYGASDTSGIVIIRLTAV